ncbi:hypothetical protein FOXYSP1_14672 [Fusarium oxysporum f. sp. phaseoli]
MVAEKPPKAPEEKPSEKSVEADNMSVKATTGHGVKGHEKAAPEAKEVRYASYYGDGSGLPLRPGMGPPRTEEEFEEDYKKIEAEEDKIFNMSEGEFNVEFPEYSKFTKDMPEYFCTEHEAWKIMEGYDEDEDRNHSEEKK